MGDVSRLFQLNRRFDFTIEKQEGERFKLLKIIDEKTTVSSAFGICDDILHQAVTGITDLILAPGIINIDYSRYCTFNNNNSNNI